MPHRTIHYADDTMDRVAARREDPAWLVEQLRAPATRFVVVAAGRHPFVLSESGVRQPCYLDAVAVDGARPGDPILLGVHAGITWFAVDAMDAAPSFPAGVALLRIREVMTDLVHRDSAILAYANALVHWHRTHRFCGACGAPTTAVRGGHMRRCDNAACARQHFPRTDPAVITLVCDGDRCLLARRRDWAPGRRSTVAGFVEPGETLEHAVAREVFEEVGVRVGEVRYRGSQPWPFPQSLMLGFRARATTTDIAVDGDEIAEADWYTPERIAADTAAGTLILPPQDSISRRLVDDWLAESEGARDDARS
ncbi:MAG: NAD(+) diphosphatase [Thiotrichales bacterium]|nr:NAD(+) diphosphatase [Thiotrichales bacterium]